MAEANGKELRLTLFNEGSDIAKQLKPGKPIRVAPAGGDRQPLNTALDGTVIATVMKGRECQVTVTLTAPEAKFQPTGLARLGLATE